MISHGIKTGLAAALVTTAAFSAPALAGASGETVAVQYSDLNLATAKGQQTLQRRLERAAEEVCGIDRRTSGAALPTSEARRCYSETVRGLDRAVAAQAEAQARG